jgi:hypothetical protein
VTSALDELREQIHELARMAADVFSAGVHDHLSDALDAVARCDPAAARLSLERASEMMEGEREHSTQWWRK